MQKLLLYLCLFLGFLNSYGQTVTLAPAAGFTNNICIGSTVQVDLDINPPSPPTNPMGTYNINWERINPDGSTDFLRNGAFNVDTNTFQRETITRAGITTLRVRVDGTAYTVDITVDPIPNAGLDTEIFLCGKTGIIDLFTELDGAPETGGTWSNGTGTYDTSNTRGGSFTYTVSNGGVCPAQKSVITVRPCGNDDTDNDGILNSVDLDDDNDGIPDIEEASFCGSSLTPIFVLEEDFGFGAPTRSKFVEGLGLTYNPNLPQDTSSDGEYNVSTSTFLRTAGGFDATFLSSDQIGEVDANGDVDGRYLAINMKSSIFANKPVFRANNLPVTPGVEYDFSMSIANLNSTDPILPDLTIEVIDQATGIAIITRNSGPIANNMDIWQTFDEKFIPLPGVNIITIQVTNNQGMDGNGNDIALDNIFLSTNACDFDRDGIPNSEDLDSDNDGIYDIVENNEAAKDADGDGRVDAQTDSASITTIVNSDSDSNPDYLDIDSDNDGIIDHVEGMATASFIAPSGADGDFNGVDDSYDTNGTVVIPTDTNTNGTPDYLDTNSDEPTATGDCLDDTTEAYDIDQDGVSDITASGTDTDNDGLDDSFDTIVLGRLTESTNGTNNGQEPTSFPDVHNPGADRDWRQEFEFSATPLTKVDICEGGATVDLFSLLPVGLATTGTWTVPTGGLPVTGGHLGTLDPTTATAELNYVYSLPDIGTCPKREYTLPVEITGVPSAGTDNTVPKCTSDPAFDLFSELGGTPSTGGVWTVGSTTTVFGTDDKGTFDPSSDAFGTYTYTVSGGAGCGNDTAVITLTIGGANAGTAPATPVTACRNDTTTINLFNELLGTPETTGTWTLPSGTTFNGIITPSDITFVSGTYNYAVTSSDPSCPDADVDIEVVITDIFAGEDATVSICTSNPTFNLFDELLNRTSDGTSPNPGGVWTVGTTATAFGTNDQGTFDPGSDLGGTYTYTVSDSSAAGCPDSTATITVTIGGANAGTAPATAITSCKDSTLSIDLFSTITGSPQTGGDWTRPDGSVFNGNLVPSDATSTTGTYTYTVTDPSNPTCPSDSVDIDVVLTDIPMVQVQNSDKVCDAVGVAATSYDITYTVTGTGTVTSDFGTVDEANLMVTGIPKDQDITLTITSTINNSCGFDLAVTAPNCDCPIVADPTNPSDETICEGDPLPALSVTIAAGFVGNWYKSDGTPIAIAQGTATYTPVDADVVTGENIFRVEAVDPTGCPSNQVDVKLTLVKNPDIVVPTINEGCEVFTLEPLAVGDYFDAAVGSPGRTQLNAGDQLTTSQTLYIYAENTVGTKVCSSEEAFSITVEPLPTPIAPTLNAAYCNSFILPALSNPATQKYFTATAGGGSELSAGDSITTTQTIFINEISAAGCSGEISFAVTIENLVGDPGTNGTLNLCTNDAPVSLISGLEGNPTDNGSWTLPDGSIETDPNFVIDPTTASQGTYTYSINTTSTCTGVSSDVEVSILGIPTPTAPITGTACEAYTLPALPANQFYSTISLTTDPNLIADLTAGQVLRSTTNLFLVEVNANNCKGEVPFIITIENLPDFELAGDNACIDNAGNITPITISSPLDTANYDIQWSLDGADLTGETNPEIIATRAGEYTIEYTSITTATCTDSRSTTISPIESPQGLSFVTGLNTVEILTTNGGNLEYSLLGNDTNFIINQTENIFRNVPPGEYLATVFNECGALSEEISIFGFPEFFTPNGDTDNDAWNVRGSTGDTRIIITVYDRYGRLMSSFDPNTPGWDGTYNDIHMPADDYWYYATTDEGDEYRGHFALLR